MTENTQQPLGRVVLLVPSLKNPFVEAWFELLQRASASAVILLDSPHGKMFDFPAPLRDKVVYAPSRNRDIFDWRAACERVLGGPPTTIFYWWGFQSLTDSFARRAWPTARTMLCVDTYPNASRPLTETREALRALPLLRAIDSLVTTSDEMTDFLAHRFSPLRSIPAVPVLSPFPLAAHSGTRDVPAGDTVRLCFTGRSDYLYAGEKRMAKDDVGRWLERLLATGATVSVQRPESPTQASLLKERGYSFYEEVPREGLMDGRFADFLSSYDAHLVYYNVANSTIRRRVSLGLSTRFATGVCAPSPLVVPPAATFASTLFQTAPIGFASEDPAEIVHRVTNEAVAMRSAWWLQHESWSGDAAIPSIARLLD